MKKITYFLIALLFCAALVGTVSAWNSNTEANINPSGSLMPGDSVSATMTITFAANSDVDRIDLTTDLTSAVWTGSLTSLDGTPITEFPAGKRYFDGYSLSDLPQDVKLTIYLDGKVPENKAGMEITVIKVEQITDSNTVISSYQSDKQMVYNPDDIPDQIEKLPSFPSRVLMFRPLFPNWKLHGIIWMLLTIIKMTLPLRPVNLFPQVQL